MADLQQLIRIAKDGHLQILSGRGLYEYNAPDNERTRRLSGTMVGTFIEWRNRDENVIEWEDGHDDA